MSWTRRFNRLLLCLFALAAANLVATGCDDTGGDPADDTSLPDDIVDVTNDTGTDTTPDTVEPDTGVDASDTAEVDMAAACGDGVVEAGEACDGDALGGATCESEGFAGGTLACAADCTLDTSACLAAVCGNGTVEGDEPCDGADLAGADCASLGQGTGTLACAADCTFDTDACSGPAPVCGDGVAEGDEVCDGADVPGEDCLSQGFTSGTLGCAADCSAIDTSGCALCGNDTIEPGEGCDGAELAGVTCEALGYGSGTLTCAPDCSTLDASACSDCGNGIIDAGEACDDTELAGQTCQDRGFDAGTLGCTASCTFDETACTLVSCGNGVIDTGEDCEGLNLGGADCASAGFDGGGLSCRSNCTFDTDACFVCGDDTTEGSETCDGTDLAGESCQGLGFPGGTLTCTSDCAAYDTSACIPVPVCGNDLREVGEYCDGTDLSGVRCESLGYLGGTLTCQSGCGGYDTSACIPCTADPREDDDTAASATPVGAGTTLADGTLCSGDPDWFALALGEGDVVDLDLLFVHADGDLDLHLYRPDGTLAAASTSGTNDEHLGHTVAVGEGGPWTVRVSSFGSAANEYSLSFAVTPFVLSCPGDDLHEQNDDQPRAEPIASGQVFSGILCSGDTLDWYGIELHEGDTITVDLSFVHADGDLDLFLYLLGPDPAASSTSTTDDEQILSFVVPPGGDGVYGILVAGQPNTYALAVDVVRGSICGDGVIEGPEECEGSDFGGESCVTQGFVSGILQCDPNTCQIDTSACGNTLACPGDDAFEENDAQAEGVLLASGGEIVNGIICSGDADWFRVAAGPGQTIQVDLFFSHAEGDLNLMLRTSTGALVRQSATTSDNESLSYTVPSNALSPYAIQIVGSGGTASAAYTLQVSVTP